MKKLLLLLLIAGISYAQSGNPIIDSLSVHRTVLDSLGTEVENQALTTGFTMTGDLTISDSDKLYFGAGNDMSLWSDGNIGHINGGTALYFKIGGTTAWWLNPSGHFTPALDSTYDIGTSSLAARNIYTKFITLGGTDLQTTLDAIAAGTYGAFLPLAGGTMTGNLDLNNEVKARFGSSNELNIYYDGSDGYMTNSSGSLQLRAAANNNLQFAITLPKWEINGINYAFYPSTTGVYDIGRSNYEVDSLYVQDVAISAGLKIGGDAIESIIQDSVKADLRSMSVTMVYPNAAEELTLLRMPYNATAQNVYAVVRGTSGCAVTFQITSGSDRSSASQDMFTDYTSVSSTSGAEVTIDGTADLDEGDWFWITTQTVTGTVYEFAVTINYTKD